MTLPRVALAAILVAGAAPSWANPRVLKGDHLFCQKIKDTAPKTSYTAKLGDLAGETVDCTIKLPAKEVCFSTLGELLDPPPPNPNVQGQLVGSFLCYSVKCARFVGFTQGIVEDEFGTRQITVRKGKRLCTPAGFQ